RKVVLGDVVPGESELLRQLNKANLLLVLLRQRNIRAALEVVPDAEFRLHHVASWCHLCRRSLRGAHATKQSRIGAAPARGCFAVCDSARNDTNALLVCGSVLHSQARLSTVAS